MEKFKLNCLKLWAILIAIAIWQNRMKQTQCNLTNCTFKKKKKIDNHPCILLAWLSMMPAFQ